MRSKFKPKFKFKFKLKVHTQKGSTSRLQFGAGIGSDRGIPNPALDTGRLRFR
jgi:hypothetical protein